jgi:hypothetical protein
MQIASNGDLQGIAMNVSLKRTLMLSPEQMGPRLMH